MSTTFDVRIWAIRSHTAKRKTADGKEKTTYSLRWIVNGRTFCDTFATSALAESQRAELITAQREGTPFDTATGLPLTMIASAATTPPGTSTRSPSST